MIILPAIDLIDGQCVRLVQGDFTQKTVYGSDPLSVAQSFQEQGAESIHIVDLQGAKEGCPCHFDLICRMAQTLSIPIEVGGGIRSEETIQSYYEAGVGSVILGSMIFDTSVSLKSLIECYGDFIRVGLDVKSGLIRTHGWLGQSHMSLQDVLAHLEEVGVSVVIYTDIHQDGMLSGIHVEAINQVLHLTRRLKIIISGGVADQTDVKKARLVTDPQRIYGLIVGKALYDQKVTLKQLLSENSSC